MVEMPVRMDGYRRRCPYARALCRGPVHAFRLAAQAGQRGGSVQNVAPSGLGSGAQLGRHARGAALGRHQLHATDTAPRPRLTQSPASWHPTGPGQPVPRGQRGAGPPASSRRRAWCALDTERGQVSVPLPLPLAPVCAGVAVPVGARLACACAATPARVSASSGAAAAPSGAASA
jgi:hypothetical protein